MGIVSEAFYKAPPDSRSVGSALLEIRSACDAVRVFNIGKSLLSKPICAAAIGNVRHNFATLFAGGFHGQEWLTTTLLIKLLDETAERLLSGEGYFGVDIKSALHERGIVVVPLVNPDGVEIAVRGPKAAGRYEKTVCEALKKYGGKWQANAAGVDINHNFDAGFSKLKIIERENGIDSPRAGKYGGERPNSQPETRAMVNLCRAFWFRRAFAFHSQGEEIYYSYGEHTPAQSLLLCRLLCASCGYTPAKAESTAAHGGFKDYFINFYHRPAFTIEIGRGENPLPVTELEPIYARLSEMLLTAMIL